MGRRKKLEYDFTLLIGGVNGLTQEVEDALFEAGCDDATISCRSGRIFLSFDREAESFRDAVISAILDIQRAGIGAIVIRVDYPELVTQADIARRIGRSRQVVSQYVTGERGPGDFPPPSSGVVGRCPKWDWLDVAFWLRSTGVCDEVSTREAQDVKLINTVLAMRYQRAFAPKETREIMQSLSCV